MSRRAKSIPKFRSEAEERYFWETHDSQRLCRLDKGPAATISKS